MTIFDDNEPGSHAAGGCRVEFTRKRQTMAVWIFGDKTKRGISEGNSEFARLVLTYQKEVANDINH